MSNRRNRHGWWTIRNTWVAWGAGRGRGYRQRAHRSARRLGERRFNRRLVVRRRPRWQDGFDAVRDAARPPVRPLAPPRRAPGGGRADRHATPQSRSPTQNPRSGTSPRTDRPSHKCATPPRQQAYHHQLKRTARPPRRSTHRHKRLMKNRWKEPPTSDTPRPTGRVRRQTTRRVRSTWRARQRPSPPP